MVGNHFREIVSPTLGIEILYSIIIITCSLMIYFGTKELYEISQHKGIKYFRQAFLFFAIAYFFRSTIKFIIFYLEIQEILEINPKIIGTATLLLFMYSSAMAIFYLLYSVMWKKWKDNKSLIYSFHALTLFISITIIISRNLFAYFALNIFLLGIVLWIALNSEKNEKLKKHNKLHIIYFLLLLFWTLNFLEILTPQFLQTFQLLIYISSSITFMIILYKVLKKSGGD